VQSSLKLTAAATTRCVAGKVVLTVVATNGDTVPMDVTVTSAAGTKSFAGVKAGSNASAAFTVRAAQLAAGEATVTATASVGGKSVTSTVKAPYAARTCG
jgi:hypothetical protein